MEFRYLTIKDMEGIEINGKTPFDVLVATAKRAKQIEEKRETIQRRQTNMHKTIYPERKREAVIISDGEGKDSLAAATATAKRKKCSVRNNKKNIERHGPQPPPPLPQEFKNVIQEMAQGKNISPEILVIQKELSSTDISKHHSRLSMPISKISHDFLTEEEKDYLCIKDKNNNKKNYIEVRIIEPSLKRDIVKLVKWDMPKTKGKTSSSYMITGNWKHIIDRNELSVEMVMQVWGFRIEEELCLALVRVLENPTENTS